MARDKNVKLAKNVPTQTKTRTPVVAVLGHVDHGKTSLLDYIRQSHVASSEAGGITQHVGAYQIEIKNPSASSGQARKITFIDTPGHEAFSAMRARGGQVADIAVLVVAADDGVMPQTKESIAHIKAAEIPFLVAINKMDLPGVSLEKIKRQLADNDVLVEGYGGEVVTVPVSAKTGEGMDELLDMILLSADMRELKEVGADFSGIVVESKLDKSQGPVATVLIKAGILRVGDNIFTSTASGRVKALLGFDGKQIKEADVATPVSVLGFSSVAKVGDVVTREPSAEVKKQDETAKVNFRDRLNQADKEEIRVIIKADASGSLEAITDSLQSLQKEDQKLKIFFSATGEISDGDVLLAASTKSLIIGFNVAISTSAERIAKEEKVLIRRYKLIYELLEELQEGLLALAEKEQEAAVLGTAEVLAIFKAGTGRVAGSKVTSGRINKGDLLILRRQERELGRSKVASMKQKESDINEAKEGDELGIILEKDLPFAKGDIIAAINNG